MNYFFRCHKSYIVNVNNVVSVNRHAREATMIDGEKVLCSVMGSRTLVKLKNKTLNLSTFYFLIVVNANN
jgi:Response regulator of the LytR/AlgR family